MSSEGLRPDTSTLTAVMHALHTLGAWRHCREKALAAWREFRRLGVQPSLASYYCLLSVFYRDREWCHVFLMQKVSFVMLFMLFATNCRLSLSNIRICFVRLLHLDIHIVLLC